MSGDRHSVIYACGRWEIDLGRRELRSVGQPLPLGGRAFEIVEALVRSAGEIVTKDQLMRLVWPGATVGEGTLHVHVSAIRRALGQDRHLLKTAQGRGYRLVGTWTPLHHGPPAAAARQLRQRRVATPPPPTNFPGVVNPLVGRSQAVQRVRDLVSAYRIVTLTGPGGIGKTALALEAGRGLLSGFGGGAWLIELAPLTDPDLVPSAVAAALGLKLGGDRISAEAVARAIGERHLLLLLDNCEHLIDAAAELAGMLVRLCPRATVLASSREVLQIHDECVYRVPALDVPGPGTAAPDGIVGHSAVELFVARTAAQDAAFAPRPEDLLAIAEICRRLDGIPLAIEFAAARAAFLGIDHVAAGLRDRFALLISGGRGVVRRHRTLRATLDWSYDLLTGAEQTLLRHLALFPAGFTLDAAVAVLQDTALDASAVTEGLASLVAKSLLSLDRSDPMARWYLLETIRAYAFEKLVQHAELDGAALNHVRYLRDLFTRPEPNSAARLSEADWARRVRELDNVRAALDWAFSAEGEQAAGVDLTFAYAPVWLHLSLMGECRARCERALQAAGPTERRVRMWLQVVLGTALINTMGSAEQARAVMTEALEAAEAIDEAQGEAGALTVLSNVSIYRGEYDRAGVTVDRLERVAERLQDAAVSRSAFRLKGIVLLNMGRPREAQGYLERSLRLQQMGSDRSRPIWFPSDHSAPTRALFARALWMQGHTRRAHEEADASIAAFGPMDYPLLICIALFYGLCRFAPLTGDFAAAEASVARLIDIASRLNAPFWRTVGQMLEGKLLVERGAFADAAALLRDGFAIWARNGWRVSYAEFKAVFAAALAGLDQPDAALAAAEEGLAQAAEHGERWYVAELLRIKGMALVRQGLEEAAEACFLEGLHVARDQAALVWELRSALGLARLRVARGRRDDARRLLEPVFGRFTDGFETPDLRAARALLEELAP